MLLDITKHRLSLDLSMVSYEKNVMPLSVATGVLSFIALEFQSGTLLYC